MIVTFIIVHVHVVHIHLFHVANQVAHARAGEFLQVGLAESRRNVVGPVKVHLLPELRIFLEIIKELGPIPLCLVQISLPSALIGFDREVGDLPLALLLGPLVDVGLATEKLSGCECPLNLSCCRRTYDLRDIAPAEVFGVRVVEVDRCEIVPENKVSCLE